ncbi:RING-type domain-containing protein [Mycena sanguinolenta]|uniref:RING-type domain-containing protein n=1 Tax=Mycena sanguinolenta TaxID=230812 RepID=A0A8H7D4W9_9AGAR|nr:RING-type domain-containing protein [Mycena sanguinolenta]
MSCSICYERFTFPVSLPCGHVFCRECVCRTVDSIKSCSLQHFCPTCRKPYCIVSIDPELVPPYLRPHIQSPIRPLFFDSAHSPQAPESESGWPSSQSQSQSQSQLQPQSQSQSQAQPQSPPSPPPQSSPETSDIEHPTAESSRTSDLGRATAAADAIRLSCATWRKRAEVHAAANAGLLAFARAAKESTVRMRGERDAARNQCLLLKRKLAEVIAQRSPDSDADSPLNYGQGQEVRMGMVVAKAPPASRGLPVFLAQQKKAMASASVNAFPGYDETTQSRFGPPLKRRKTGESCALDSGSGVRLASVPVVASQ